MPKQEKSKIHFCLPIYFIAFLPLFSSRWAFIWPDKKKWFDDEREKVVIGIKAIVMQMETKN